MKKNLTELVFILDRSGSMQGLEGDTIGGFNAMIEKQKKEPGEAFVSTVLFDDQTEVLHDRVELGNVRPITDKEYYVRGCTALLDAVGGAIHHIGNIHKYARSEDVPEHTLFVITTDGMENASRRYSVQRVKEMIQRQKEKYGWEFLFLGANIDAVETAGHLPRPGSELPLRQRGYPPQLRGGGSGRGRCPVQRAPGRTLEGRHRGGLPQAAEEGTAVSVGQMKGLFKEFRITVFSRSIFM